MDLHLFFAVFWVNYWLVAVGFVVAILLFSWLSSVLAKKTERPEIDFSGPKSIVTLGIGIFSVFNVYFAVYMSGWFAFFATAFLWLSLGYVFVAGMERRFVSLKEAGKELFHFLFLDFRAVAEGYKLRKHLTHGGTEENFVTAKKEVVRPPTWKILLVTFLGSVVAAVLIGILVQGLN